MGWNKWQKKNKNKTAQLLLYKKFYSEQFNHPIDGVPSATSNSNQLNVRSVITHRLNV